MDKSLVKDIKNQIKQFNIKDIEQLQAGLENILDDDSIDISAKKMLYESIINWYTRAEKHANNKIKTAKFREQLQQGILKSFTLPPQNWDDEYEVDFLTLADYTTARRVLLCADMGTGKNYALTNSAVDFYMLVPYRTIVGQSGSGNNPREDRVLTYDQSKNLLKMLMAGDFNPADKVLVVDEAHNLLLADYRLEALNNVVQLSKYNWKQVVFQSATVHSKLFEGFLQFDKKIRIKKRNAATLNYTRCLTGPQGANIHSIGEILRMLTSVVGRKDKNIILRNNKDECIEIKRYLENNGLSCAIVDSLSTKKNDEIAYKLANNSDFKMEDYKLDVLIGTNSLVEGINIKDNVEVFNVFIVDGTGFSPDLIKQLAGRGRNAKTINVYHHFYGDINAFVDDKDAWLAMYKRNAEIEYRHAKKWVEHSNSRSNESANARSNNADYEVAQKPNFKRNGIVYDANIMQYRLCELGDLFANNACNNAQFYADFHYADKVLKSLGFKIKKYNRPIVHDSMVEDIKHSNKLVKNAERTKRETDAIPVVAAINKFFDESKRNDYFHPCIIFNAINVRGKMTDFQEKICMTLKKVSTAKVVDDQLVNALTKEQILDGVQWLVEGKNDAEVVRELNALNSSFGIRADFRHRYPKGAELTIAEQNTAISRAVTILVESVRISSEGFITADAAVEWVLKNNGLDRIRNNRDKKDPADYVPPPAFTYTQNVNGEIDVVANLKQPKKTLEKYIPKLLEGRTKMVNGIRSRTVIVG